LSIFGPIQSGGQANTIKDIIKLMIKPTIIKKSGTESKKMTINGQDDFVYTYEIDEYVRMPKILTFMISPLQDPNDNTKRQPFGPVEQKYINGINICFSIKPVHKQTKIVYVLTSMVCFQGLDTRSGHFVTIAISDISSTTFTYINYNDSAQTTITFPIAQRMFPAAPIKDNNLYPYILIYERFSNIKNNKNPP